VLLALDSATPAVSVAVADGSRVLAHRREVQGRRHAELLVPLVRAALAEAGVAGAELSEVLVGVGPGAYTGLRVGIATATALALAWGVPVHGVCSLDALAAEHAAQGDPGSAFLVVTDARRAEVFWALYDRAGHRRDGPTVSAPADVPHRDLRAVGAGALVHRDEFVAASPPEHPDAGWLARAVVQGSAPRMGTAAQYLRRPDARLPAGRKHVLQPGSGR
jgi:tRNA threonylcarbamoyl adenosine modification protein YeaZ